MNFNKNFLKQVYAYYCLMRFDRPIGTYLLLWPVLSALWLASQGLPNTQLIIIFILGVFVMRAAGSVLNDIADRNIDGKVLRTKDRPLANNSLSLRQALLCLLCLLSIALLLVLQLDIYTILLAPIGLLTAVLYPFFKRFFPCPQLALGVTWSWGILMAFSAVQGYLSNLAWLLYLTNFVLTVAYDTMYAMSDREDDLRIGLHSSAILFGAYDRLIVAILQVCVLFLYILIGLLAKLNIIYFIFLTFSAGLFVYQQVLIKDYDPKKCLTAFKSNNQFGFLIFLGFFFGI